MFKIWCRLNKWTKKLTKKKKKKKKKKFVLKVIAFEARGGKYSQSQTGYLSSAVNVLTNTPKISHTDKGDIFEIISLQKDEKYDKKIIIDILQVFGTL